MRLKVLSFVLMMSCTRTPESAPVQTSTAISAAALAPTESITSSKKAPAAVEGLDCYKFPKGEPKKTGLKPGDPGYDEAVVIDCMECNTPVILWGFSDREIDPFGLDQERVEDPKRHEARELYNQYLSASHEYVSCYFDLQAYIGRRDPTSLGFGKYKDLRFSDAEVEHRSAVIKSVLEEATFKVVNFEGLVPGFRPDCRGSCYHYISTRYFHVEELRELGSTLLSAEVLKEKEALGYQEVYSAWQKATDLAAKTELKRELCRVSQLPGRPSPYSSEQLAQIGECLQE